MDIRESEWEDQIRSVRRWFMGRYRICMNGMYWIQCGDSWRTLCLCTFIWSMGICNGEYYDNGVFLARPTNGDATNDDFSTFSWILPSAIVLRVAFLFPTVLDSQLVDFANLFPVCQWL